MKKTIAQIKTEILVFLQDRDTDNDIPDEQQDARRLLAEVADLLPFETFLGKHFRIKRDHLLFKQNGKWLEIGLNKSGDLVILLDTSEKESDVRSRLSVFWELIDNHDDTPTPWGFFLGMTSGQLKWLLEGMLKEYLD